MLHLFALICRFNKQLPFPCRTLKYAIGCDEVGTVTSRSDIDDWSIQNYLRCHKVREFFFETTTFFFYYENVY